MTIKLNLKHSFNNYHWKDKEELKGYINYMLSVLWELEESNTIESN